MTQPAQLIVGKGVDPATVAYTSAANSRVPVSVDMTTGAVMVVDRAKTPQTDGVRAHVPEPTPVSFVTATSTSTSYVFTSAIDCADYDRVAFWPNVTTTGATTCTWKIQFSFDGSNWFDDPYESSFAAAVANERIPTVDTVTPQFNGAVGGYAPLNAALSGPRIVQKKARFARVGQKSGGAVTVATSYYFQLL